jgi:hypothetical protein
LRNITNITVATRWSRSIFLPLVVFWIGISATPAFGNITYSGPQNISLQGVPDTTQVLTIHLAGDSGSWDALNLSVSTTLDAGGGGGGGANNIFAGAEVAMTSSSGGFPLITRFNYGDPYPASPLFGSGSEILWGFGTGPADGDFFAAVVFGTFGTGPAYLGWVHLSVSNSATSSPTVTVIDWAYSDQPIAMGQGAPSTARIHIGLANSDDVGIRFDLRAEVYRNGAELLGFGELSSVPGGSSGFNSSQEFTIPLALPFPPVTSPGDIVSIRLLARNACSGSGKNSGRARLWYNDPTADSGFDAIVTGQPSSFFLIDGAQLDSTPGGGPKRTIDIVAGAKCSPYKSFGVWSRTLP